MFDCFWIGEIMIHPVIPLLGTIFVGAVVLMLGILLCRESEKSFSEAFRECLYWGTGFFVAMSVQVIAISTL
jgi:hypothetical protein